MDHGGIRQRRPRRTGRFVAVIGSGAAGLAAADMLNQAGHFVTIFERAARAGGRLRDAIVGPDTANGALDRYLITLAGDGVVFRTRVHVGIDLPIDWLWDDYNAIVVAIGDAAGLTSGRLLAGLTLQRTPAGMVWCSDEGMTSIPGIFLAVRPAGVQPLTAPAIAEGRRIARGVDAYLARSSRVSRSDGRTVSNIVMSSPTARGRWEDRG